MTQDNILDRVRNSCRQVASSPSHVKINHDKLKEFAQEIAQKKDQIKDNFYNKNIVYPLSFESIDTEINFHCLMSMLQFGSGFRKELHQQNKRVRILPNPTHFYRVQQKLYNTACYV